MKVKKLLIPYIGISFGSIVMAFSIMLFIGPNKIVPGGIMGIANIIHQTTKFPMGAATLCMSIPIFFIGLFTLGKSVGLKTIYCNIVYSVAIDLLSRWFPVLTHDLFLSAIFGGGLMGTGVAIILGFGGTFGGTDLAARITNKYFPSLPVQWIMFSIDLLVIICGGIFFGPEIALFSIVTIFISTKLVDTIQEGVNYGKSIFIISDKAEAISEVILAQVERGVTSLKGTGMYTKRDRDVLYCIVKRSQVVHVKNLVLDIDPKAFITIGDVREVVGKGFQGSFFS